MNLFLVQNKGLKPARSAPCNNTPLILKQSRPAPPLKGHSKDKTCFLSQ